MFLNSVYVRQGEIEKLVTVNPAKRKELISKLLNIQDLEKAYDKLPEVKPGSFNVSQVLKDYFKDEQISELSIELLKHLRENDVDGAENVAEEYYKSIQEKSGPK